MAIQDAPAPRPREEGEGARRNNLLDVLAWTMLGEAANQGDTGMSAIAHVVLNRANSGNYPNDPLKVALQPKQFSAWNDTSNGGNNPKGRYPKGSESFQHARQLASDVLSGKTPDPTGGATHYWAPVGMKGGADPYWAASEERRTGNGRIALGDHIFLPHYRDAPTPATMSPGARERAGGAQTIADAAAGAWPSGPPLPRRRPDAPPVPPADIPYPRAPATQQLAALNAPAPATMSAAVQQARAVDRYPPLPPPAPLQNPMASRVPKVGSAVPRTQAPLSGTVSGLVNGTISEVQLPRAPTQTASAVPIRTASGVPMATIQATDPNAPNPAEMSPALRSARQRLQAARDARNGIQTAAGDAWDGTRRVEPRGAIRVQQGDYGFEPVPQGGRPNIDVPGEVRWATPDTSIDAMRVANAVQGAAKAVPQPQRKSLVAPQPAPYPAGRMVDVPPPPNRGNWMTAAAEGIPRMQEQVQAAMPKGNPEPSWYDQQTGNTGSRGPTAVQMLGMINTNRLMNSLASAPTISTTYRRRDAEPQGYPSPTDYAEYARVANSLGAMRNTQPTGQSLSSVTRDVMANGIPWWQADNPGNNSISSPTGSPFWSYN